MLKVISLAVLLALTAACRWNPGQQAVYDRYADLSAALDDGRFQDLYDGLSYSTQDLLEQAAQAFTRMGMPIDGRGEALLAEISANHDLFTPGVNVIDIYVRGESALLEPAGRSGGPAVEFVFEDGVWRLDLTGRITGILSNALRGTGTSLGEFLDPAPRTPIQAGSCRLMVRNGLEGADVYYIFVSPSVSDDWGPDALGNRVILPGAVCTLHVYSDTYDLMAIDAADNAYVKWGVSIGNDGYGWDINRSDLVQQ